MYKFKAELSQEIVTTSAPGVTNWFGVAYHVAKLHKELLLLPEEEARAFLNYFDSVQELLDYYAASEGARPVLPASEGTGASAAAEGFMADLLENRPPVVPAPSDHGHTLRRVYIWRQRDDEKNAANLPEVSGALSFELANDDDRQALVRLLFNRIAGRRVPAFCAGLDYVTAERGVTQQALCEVWRCVPDTVPLQFTTDAGPAAYYLVGGASANPVAQTFSQRFLAPLGEMWAYD